MSGFRRNARGAVATLLLAACGALQAHDDEAAAAARLPRRVALLERAQAELERGDAAAALDDFERAAMMLHAADAELGLIRAAMQDGQYRRALAFCAHTAGEHTDGSDGAALYAWLLQVGGQGVLAARTLADARAQAPSDPLLAAVGVAFAAEEQPVATGLLREPAHRMAPWPVASGEDEPPASARLAGNAVLVDAGDAALMLVAARGAGAYSRVWVRNGLGQSTEATLVPADDATAGRGLVRLQLRKRLPVGASTVGRAPFAGAPAYAMQFGRDAAPAWPMLSAGFLAAALPGSDVRKLGFAAAPGAAVLDAGGRLVGIARAGTPAQATWTPLPDTDAAESGATPSAHAGLAAPDSIYEAGLRRTLQVLLVDAPG